MSSTLPIDVDGITPAWLDGALAARHPGVRVRSIEVLEQQERTNCNAQIGVTYDVAAGAPATLFCKLAPQDPEHRARIDASGMGTREAWFYRDLAASVSMRMPQSYLSDADADGNFVLVLEDLMASGCVISEEGLDISDDAAMRAIEDLAALHAANEDLDRLYAVAPWLTTPRVSGTEMVVQVLQIVVDNHADVLSEAYVEVARLFIEHHAAIIAMWDEGPRSLIHGDTHIGNLFVDDGRVGFLDWGLLSVSPGMRDISYFMTMGMDIEHRRRIERDLVQHYVDARRSLGAAPLTFDDAWMAHRIHAAYTVLASFLSLIPPYNTESRKEFTTAFRARSIAALDDLDTVAALRARL